jgi:hypothetical protein
LSTSGPENKSLQLRFIFLLSAILGVISFLLIGIPILFVDFVIPISFGIFIFFFNFILLLLLSDKQISRTFTLKTTLLSKGFLYIALGVIASIFILAPNLAPNSTVQFDATSILFSFSSMSLLSYPRIISAFFLTGFFPGIIVYFVFFKKYDFNVVEKIGLFLLISYCFTMISGLLLGLIQAFSTVTYVLTFWLFAISMFGYVQIKQRRNKAELPIKIASFSIDLNLIALAFAAIALVIFAYIQVLASHPMSGIVGGDVLDYMVAANRFAWSDIAGWSPYVWSNNFYLLISNLAALPMHFVYAGLQFYLIIPAGAFYFLVRTIFPDHKKIAAISTMLCFFAAGVTSWGIFNASAIFDQMKTSPGMFPEYLGKNVLDVLFSYTGFSGITPLALSPWIFDFGFLFFALAFVYRGVSKKERKLVNYILPAIFIAAAYFSHNFSVIFVFIFSLIFAGLFLSKCLVYVLKLSLLTIALVLAIDPLSKWMFIDTVFAFISRLGPQFSSGFPTYFFVITAVAIGIAGLFLLFKVKKRKLYSQPKRSSNLVERIKIAFSNNKTKTLFYIGAFLFFGVAVFLYLLNYGTFVYSLSWNSSNFSNFYWYWIVFRSFGIILPFALASIPFMISQERSSLLFTSIMSLAIFASTVITVSLPAIIPPYIGYVRYVSYLVIPLSILAAFGILNSLEHLKKRHFRKLFVVLLVVLVSTSILSQGYGRERLFDLGQSHTEVTLVYNLPGISGGLHLTGDAIAKIFNGTITKWDEIAILNPSASAILPNQPIIKFYRSDSSDTTYVFTRYLADQDRNIIVGSQWLLDGQGKRGNSGVASAVSSTQYSIGYVELAYALANNLNVVSVQNLWFREDTLALRIPDNPLSADSVEAIDWINVNLPKGATILPLSLSSEKILSNLVLDVKVTPNFQTWRLMGVLNSSSREILMYCLNTLGINYVFADAKTDSKDFFSDSFNSTIKSLPMVYSNNETTIYQTRTSVFNDSTGMPYLDSLFKKITYSLYEEDTGSTPMNNKVIWFNDIIAAGITTEIPLKMQISSNMISLNENKLFVSSMSVSANNGNTVLGSKALSNVSIIGAGDILVQSPIVRLSNTSGSNVFIDLSESQNVSLTFRNADINFTSGSYQSFRNVNVSIVLGQSNPLVTVCSHPIIEVNGNLTGLALGLAQSKTFYQNVTLSGSFTSEFPLTDNNLLYTQITNVKELNINVA